MKLIIIEEAQRNINSYTEIYKAIELKKVLMGMQRGGLFPMHEKNDQAVLTWINEDDWMMDILTTVHSLHLPDWWVCAGFVRSKIWDIVHEYNKRTPLSDIDVIYFDPSNRSEEEEKRLERHLHRMHPNVPWSMKNQARMHLANDIAPYSSSVDAITKFPETATALGVKLDEQRNLTLTAPHGLEDVLNVVVKPTDYFKNNKQRMEIYRERIAKKHWAEKWEKLQYIEHYQI